MKKRKSYIQKIIVFIDRMRSLYESEESTPGPVPEQGGEIDPENPTVVDFGAGTSVEPIDPEQPNVRVLALGSDMSVIDNVLNLVACH